MQIRVKKINTFLNGKPVVPIKYGEIQVSGLKDIRIREEELYGMFRVGGIRNMGEVEFAILERTGELSIFKYVNDKPVTKMKLFLIFSNSYLSQIRRTLSTLAKFRVNII